LLACAEVAVFVLLIVQLKVSW